MQIVTIMKPAYLLIQVKGNFTYADRTTFKDVVDKAAQADCKHMVVDIQGVNFLDSAALGILVLTHQRFQQEQRRFSLLKPTEQCMKLLTIAGIHKRIPIFQSEQAITAATAA
ncbi:MAG: STAS domain-containing protein [Nitrospira sp.]|nr:STAS domain-containing protein [Nitrospira sp.]